MDIMERMKNTPPREVCEHGSQRVKCPICELSDAEAEIERLRAVVRQYEDERETDLGGADDAADRLSMAVNGHKAGARELLGGNDCILFKQSLAEIERLRAALREIADGMVDVGGNRRVRFDSCDIARRALGEKT